MAYLNIQKAEFNRATENLIEIAWKYESLKVEYDFLTNTDSIFRNCRTKSIRGTTY